MTRLSTDIHLAIYMIPIMIILSLLMFSVIASSDDSFYVAIPMFAVFYSVIAIAFIVALKCKMVFYTENHLYIKTVMKQKLIEKIPLEHVQSIDFWGYPVVIKYTSDNLNRKVITIPERKTFHSESGMSTAPGMQFMWGKPENKIKQLKRLIEIKKNK